ncbi:MAG TPA: hypothetical protein VMV28_02520 [Thermoplasmata archaeon]|nr:hypothetical protein [Thermoplasmata archaeon]
MALVRTSVSLAARDRKKAAKWSVGKLGFRVRDEDKEHWMTTTDAPREALAPPLRGGPDAS